MTTYSYSFDEEQYYGDSPTVEDAIAEAVDSMEEGQNLYVGENKKYTAHQFVDPYAILDLATDWAGDEIGESSQDWLIGLMKDKKKLAELKKLAGGRLDTGQRSASILHHCQSTRDHASGN